MQNLFLGKFGFMIWDAIETISLCSAITEDYHSKSLHQKMFHVYKFILIKRDYNSASFYNSWLQLGKWKTIPVEVSRFYEL